MNSRESGRQVPKFYEDAIGHLISNGLNEEGLFRLSGSATQIKQIKLALDKAIPIDWKQHDLHDGRQFPK